MRGKDNFDQVAYALKDYKDAGVQIISCLELEEDGVISHLGNDDTCKLSFM